jgi:hypothetical protein
MIKPEAQHQVVVLIFVLAHMQKFQVNIRTAHQPYNIEPIQTKGH